MKTYIYEESQKRNMGRGQVSIFIGLGVLILIIGAILIFTLKPSSLERGELLVQRAPQQALPVQNYVHSCMTQVGEDAIRIISERGGYIYHEYGLSPSIYNIQVNPQDPTQGNALPFIQDLSIPYWSHLSSSNTASTYTFDSLKPQLTSDLDDGLDRLNTGEQNMEAQLDTYMNLAIEDCLDDFQVFDSQGLNVQKAGQVPITTSYITEDAVIFNLKYPLNIEVDGDITTIEEFGVSLPVRLKDLYQTAELIQSLQTEYQFVESNILNQLVYYSDIDGALPPMNEFTFEFGGSGNEWQVSEVKTLLETILVANTQLLQVEGANNYFPVQTSYDAAIPVREKVYNDMTLPIASTTDQDILDQIPLSDLNIDFVYLDWWPSYFNAGDGVTIKPELVGVDLQIFQFGFQKYNTYYDLSWPVLVTINDPTAFNGQGLTFQFAIEGNIRNNRALTPQSIPGTTLTPQIDICEGASVPLTVIVQGDQCDDELNCNPISDAGIIFKSGERSCFIGKTNSNGTLNALIPSGVLNGLVTVSGSNYLSESVQYTTGADTAIIKGLRTFKEMDIDLKKIIAKRPNYRTIDQTPMDLDGQQAIITFSRHNIEGDDGDYQTVVNFPEQSTVRLVDGLYDVDILLLSKPDATLGASLVTGATDLVALNGSDDIELDNYIRAINSNTAMGIVGGASWVRGNITSNPLDIDRLMIRHGKEILLYALEFENMTLEDASIVSQLQHYTVAHENALLPEIKR